MGKRKKSGCLSGILAFLILLFFMCAGIAAAGIFLLKQDNTGELTKEKIVRKEIPYQQIHDAGEDDIRKYYFEQLEGEEQMAYLEILQGLRESREEIYVHCRDAQTTNKLFQYVLRDYPEIFWCEGITTATSYGGDEEYTVLEPVYSYNMAERDKRQAEIDKAVSECLAGIEITASDYDKILYIYNYIVELVDYNLESEDNQNIYSVFVNHSSVCAGYSKAAQYLLERLDVFCTYITGTTKSGQSHAWNLVICDGDYYYVDTTWGDPVFQGQEGEELQKELNYVSYDYMCCSDEELFRTHMPDVDIELPSCTKMDCNYYVVNGMYYDSYNSNEALGVMNDIISRQDNPVVLKYADAEVYAQAHEDIFENIVHRAAQNLAQRYRLSQVKYSYIDDDKLNKIVIYWEYDA